MFEKNISWLVRDQENMADVEKSPTPSQRALADSSWQHVIDYCPEAKL